jgi:hypothetical protein
MGAIANLLVLVVSFDLESQLARIHLDQLACTVQTSSLIGAKSTIKSLRQCTANVAVGSKPEVAGLLAHVRSTPRSRHRQAAPACPKSANMRHRLGMKEAAN